MVDFVRGETWEDEDEVYETCNFEKGCSELNMFLRSYNCPIKRIQLRFMGHNELPEDGPLYTPEQREALLKLFNEYENSLFRLENVSKEVMDKISGNTSKMGFGNIKLWIAEIPEKKLPDYMERAPSGKYHGEVVFNVEENKGPWPVFEHEVA